MNSCRCPTGRNTGYWRPVRSSCRLRRAPADAPCALSARRKVESGEGLACRQPRLPQVPGDAALGAFGQFVLAERGEIAGRSPALGIGALRRSSASAGRWSAGAVSPASTAGARHRRRSCRVSAPADGRTNSHRRPDRAAARRCRERSPAAAPPPTGRPRSTGARRGPARSPGDRPTPPRRHASPPDATGRHRPGRRHGARAGCPGPPRPAGTPGAGTARRETPSGGTPAAS